MQRQLADRKVIHRWFVAGRHRAILDGVCEIAGAIAQRTGVVAQHRTSDLSLLILHLKVGNVHVNLSYGFTESTLWLTYISNGSLLFRQNTHNSMWHSLRIWFDVLNLWSSFNQIVLSRVICFSGQASKLRMRKKTMDDDRNETQKLIQCHPTIQFLRQFHIAPIVVVAVVLGQQSEVLSVEIIGRFFFMGNLLPVFGDFFGKRFGKIQAIFVRGMILNGFPDGYQLVGVDDCQRDGVMFAISREKYSVRGGIAIMASRKWIINSNEWRDKDARRSD